jgi:hypothetical protein
MGELSIVVDLKTTGSGLAINARCRAVRFQWAAVMSIRKLFANDRGLSRMKPLELLSNKSFTRSY